MKILSNKKYNDLISKQFRGIFADVNDDNLLRENGLLYGENKELKQEIERLNNIINELEKDLYKIRELTFNKYNSNEWNNCLSFNDDILPVINRLKELKGSISNEQQ